MKATVNSPAVDRTGAADYLGIRLSLLAQLTASGEVRSFRIGRRRLYLLSDLDAFLEAQREAG